MNEQEYNAAELDPLILFVDNHLLAINKPAGLLSQDSGTGLRNLEDWAREWVRVEKQKPGAVFLNAVHRIDRGVGGVVLFARTSKALARLNADIRNRDCRKLYHALVENRPPKDADTLVHWLTHEERRARVVPEGGKEAQCARLSYRVLGGCGTFHLLEVDLETGRYHQIRAQLAAIGCPIVGDVKYGSAQAADGGEIALHHRHLEIVHPTRNERLSIEAPYPATSPWWRALQ